MRVGLHQGIVEQGNPRHAPWLRGLAMFCGEMHHYGECHPNGKGARVREATGRWTPPPPTLLTLLISHLGGGGRDGLPSASGKLSPR